MIIGSKIELFPLNHVILGRQNLSLKSQKNLIKTKMPSLLAPWKTFSLLILKHLHSDEFGLNSVNIKENFGRPEVSINTPK